MRTPTSAERDELNISRFSVGEPCAGSCAGRGAVARTGGAAAASPSQIGALRSALAPRPDLPTDSTRPSDHVMTSTREAIEARGASLLYLPSYSPDLNPIEIAFNKLKRLLRSAAERAADALWSAIGS